jgi:hypothetical protein
MSVTATERCVLRVLRPEGGRTRPEGTRDPAALRCPRCGGELIVRLLAGRRRTPCRCPVRRGVALRA